jgi:glycosyltransferase involved in cell wall biosynthesis
VRSRALRIGIDARAAYEVPAGRGRVVRELLRALGAREDPHRYICYARRRWPEPLDERFAWRLIAARDPIWHVAVAARAARECDVFLATNSYLSAILNATPTVVIVHDLVTFDRALAPRRRSVLIERLTLGLAVRRARGLVCVSEATAGQLIARFPAAASRTVVARLGVSPELSAPAPEEADSLPPPGFVLAVGTLEPRKNLPRLVEAYRRLPPDLQAAHPLVVVGARGWSEGPTLAALSSLGNRAAVLGHVSDAALAELYRRCAVFCYPSLAEGFGLPVLEAMAAGAAVLTSNVSSLPEVGGNAVAYADPHSEREIAAALGELLVDPGWRFQLGAAAEVRAREFTWSAFAATVLAVLERGARRSPGA